MDQNNKLHLTIELDFDAETVSSHNLTLEKAMNWVKVREDAIVNDIRIRINTPRHGPSDEHIHLPAGFLANKGSICKTDFSSTLGEVYEIVQAGDPFAFVHGEEDAIRLVDTLMGYTSPLNHLPDGSAIPADSCLDQALRRSESFLLQACCLFLQSECLDEDFSLCSVMKLLRSSCEEDSIDLKVTSIMDILFHDLELREPEHPAVSAYDSFKTTAGMRIAEVALVSCIHRLETLSLLGLSKIIAEMEGSYTHETIGRPKRELYAH